VVSPQEAASVSSFSSSAFLQEERPVAAEAIHHAYVSCRPMNVQGSLIMSEYYGYGSRNSEGHTSLFVNRAMTIPDWHPIKTVPTHIPISAARTI
jgi:hypothetical protein